MNLPMIQMHMPSPLFSIIAASSLVGFAAMAADVPNYATYRLTDAKVDVLAKTDNVGLLDNDLQTSRTTARRIGELASPTKVISLVTEILNGDVRDGKPLQGVAYANAALSIIGHCAVRHKADSDVTDQLYSLLRRAMLGEVKQLDLASEQTPRLRLVKNGVLPAIDIMVAADIIPKTLISDLKSVRTHPEIATSKDTLSTIDRIVGIIVLKGK